MPRPIFTWVWRGVPTEDEGSFFPITSPTTKPHRHSASQAKSIFHQKSAFLIVALPLLSATPHPSSSLSAGGQLKTSSFDPHFSLWSTLSFFTCFEAHRGVGSRMCWRMPLFRGDRDKVK